MKSFILQLKWYLSCYWEQLNLYKLILLGTLIWLCGVWLWMIPVYKLRLQEVQQQNKRLSMYLSMVEKPQHLETVKQNIIISETLSYIQLMDFAQRNHLSLEEYREIPNEKQKKYQIKVKGKWLEVRKYIDDIETLYKKNIEIQSIDLLRDEATNQVSLTLTLQE